MAAGFTARAYPIEDGPSCIIDEPFPQNGTVTHDNRVPLQVTRFLTTDLRLEAQVAGPLLAALGAGMAWRTAHAGPDVPELLGGLAIKVPSRSNFWFAFGAEYFIVRTAWDEWQVTYTNSMAVSSTPPVRKHQWQSGLSLTFSAIRVF